MLMKFFTNGVPPFEINKWKVGPDRVGILCQDKTEATLESLVLITFDRLTTTSKTNTAHGWRIMKRAVWISLDNSVEQYLHDCKDCPGLIP